MNIKNNKRLTLIRMARSMKEYKISLIISILLAVGIVYTTLLIPVYIGRAIDLMLGKRNVDFINIGNILLRLCLLIALTGVFQWSMTFINNKIAYNLGKKIRNAAFEKIHRLPIKYIDTNSHGEIISKIINDVEQFLEGILMGLSQFITGVLTIIFTLLFMLRVSIGISLVVILITPISMLVSAFIAKKTYVYFKEQAKRRGEMTSIVEEMISGASTVKAYNVEKKVSDTFNIVDEELKKAGLKAIFYSSITNPSTRFVNSIVYAGVGITGAILCLRGMVTIGQLTCLLSYSKQYTQPFNEISGVIAELQNSIACAARIFEFLDEEEIQEDIKDSVYLSSAKGDISVENISFSYDGKKEFIKNLSFSLKSGENIAIVGPTGCGKTTLINLLMRFYELNDGKIHIDGNEIREIKRYSLLQNYGMVLQEIWLKNASIKDNIALGKKDVGIDEVIEIAKQVKAHSFIKKLPEGYDTVLVGQGENLSLGQRQLICICRAMLARPNILILDEATSSIDTRTEMKIGKALDKLMKNRSAFIVAHRLSTIKNADCILVMKDGKLIESGTHNELMGKKSFYADMYNSQFEAYV